MGASAFKKLKSIFIQFSILVCLLSFATGATSVSELRGYTKVQAATVRCSDTEIQHIDFTNIENASTNKAAFNNNVLKRTLISSFRVNLNLACFNEKFAI